MFQFSNFSFIKISKKFRFNQIFQYQFLIVFLLGFSAGIPLAIYGSTLSMWLSRLDISVKTVGLFSLVSLPFSFKFVWSYIFDYVKIPFLSKKVGFRKSWLLIIQLCLILSIVMLGQSSPKENITLTAALALIVAFFSASQDIVIDAFRIEILSKEQQAVGVSLYIYGYRIAMLISGAGSLLLADYFSWDLIFTIMGATIFIAFCALLFFKEPYRKEKPLLETIDNDVVTRVTAYILEPLRDLFKTKYFIYILLFITLYKIPDTMLSSLQTKFYVEMGYSNAQIAYVTKILGFAMAMVGMFIGGIVYYRFGTFKTLLLIGVLQAISNLVFIPITFEKQNLSYLSIAISFENLTWAMNNVAFVAYLGSLCKFPFTATQYAVLSSFANIGRSFVAASSGYIVHSFGWVNFIIITALLGIPSLILLFKIFPKRQRHERI